MAQTQFVLSAPKKVDATTALAAAKAKDSRNVNFHIPADKDEILTLTGDILEIAWTQGEGKDKREGTILAAAAKKADGTEFEACFPSSATFEKILTSIKKDVKIKVCRDGYVYPGRSSSRDVDTVVWAK